MVRLETPFGGLMRLVKLTHANVMDESGGLTTVYADIDAISFWYYSQAAKATLVLGPGAIVPVKESAEAVALLKQGETKRAKRTK